MSNLFIVKEKESPCSVLVKKMEELKILLQILVQGACLDEWATSGQGLILEEDYKEKGLLAFRLEYLLRYIDE